MCTCVWGKQWQATIVSALSFSCQSSSPGELLEDKLRDHLKPLDPQPSICTSARLASRHASMSMLQKYRPQNTNSKRLLMIILQLSTLTVSTSLVVVVVVVAARNTVL